MRIGKLNIDKGAAMALGVNFIWMGVALWMNYDWYKHCNRLNDDWYEKAVKLEAENNRLANKNRELATTLNIMEISDALRGSSNLNEEALKKKIKEDIMKCFNIDPGKECEHK